MKMSINRKVADCKMEAKATFGCVAAIVVLIVTQIITYYYKYFLHYPYLRSPNPLYFQQKTALDEFLSKEPKLKSNANIPFLFDENSVWKMWGTLIWNTKATK